MTVTAGIQSVTNMFVHVNFNFGDGEGTLCNGDSGSAVVIDGHAGDGIPSIALGVYTDGDYCTTVGWFQRIDTKEFKDFNLVVTGYGIAGYGNSHSSDIPGAGPTGHNGITGLRDKMTVTTGIQSVAKTFVHVNFNFGDGKGTLCNGDSGSAVVIDGHAGAGKPSIALGVYVDGDYCTTVGWFQRIDTKEFKDFLVDTLESN